MTSASGGNAVAQVLHQLHAQLVMLLPELLKLDELLRASLGLHQASEVAALLFQRQQQCVAAVTLLRGLPAGAAGRETEGLQALLAAKPFIESSAAMLRDLQNLQQVLTGPQSPDLEQQPSLDSTEKTWRQYGIQIAPRTSLPGAAPAAAGSHQQHGQQQRGAQQLAQQQQQMPLPQLPQQLAAQQAQQAQQGQARQAPLGLALLLQQQQAEQQAMPPPPAKAASPAASQPQPAPAPLAAELLFGQSIEMLPAMPSIGGLPSLSQLLEEPMMTLSLQDNDWGGPAAEAAAAAVAAVGGGTQADGQAREAQQQQQQQQQEQQQQQQQQEEQAAAGDVGLLRDDESSLQLFEELLMPVAEGSGMSFLFGASISWPPPGATMGPVAGMPAAAAPSAAAAAAAAAAQPAAAQQPAAAAAQPAAAQQPPAWQQAPASGRATVTTGPLPLAAAPRAHQAQPCSKGGAKPASLPFGAPLRFGQSPPARLASAELAAVQLAKAQSAPMLPALGSGEVPQGSTGSGPLYYRRVSFAPLHSRNSTEQQESGTLSSRPSTTAAGASFMVRPPAPPTSAPSFLARPPGTVTLPSAPPPVPAPPSVLALAADVTAAGAAAWPASGAGAAPAAAAQAAAPAPRPPAATVAVVQAGLAMRIAHSAAATVPSAAQDDASHLHSTTATAEGPVSYVSVHEATPHDFSQGETSLTRLFYVVKETGTLPPPEAIPEEAAEEGGDTSTYHSGRSRASGGSGDAPLSCADSASKGQLAGGAAAAAAAADSMRQTRSRRAQQLGPEDCAAEAAAAAAAAAPAQEEVIGGTKRRKGGQ